MNKIELPAFAIPGDKIVFLNRNGYDAELAQAAAVFKEGETYTVQSLRVGGWKSEYTFEGIESSFNTVMFSFADPEAAANTDEDMRARRDKAYDDSQTYTYNDERPQTMPYRDFVQISSGEYVPVELAAHLESEFAKEVLKDLDQATFDRHG